MSNHVQTDGYNEEDTMYSAMMGLFFYRWGNSIKFLAYMYIYHKKCCTT